MPRSASRSKFGVLTQCVPYALAWPMSSAMAKRILGREAPALSPVRASGCPAGRLSLAAAIETAPTHVTNATGIKEPVLPITRPSIPARGCASEAAIAVQFQSIFKTGSSAGGSSRQPSPVVFTTPGFPGSPCHTVPFRTVWQMAIRSGPRCLRPLDWQAVASNWRPPAQGFQPRHESAHA